MTNRILKNFNLINEEYQEYLDEAADKAKRVFMDMRAEFFNKYPGLEKIYYIVDEELQYDEPTIHVYLNDEKMKLHDFYDPEYRDHILYIFDEKYHGKIDSYIKGTDPEMSSKELKYNDIEDLKDILIEYYDEICENFVDLIAVLPFNILYNMYCECNCFKKEYDI